MAHFAEVNENGIVTRVLVVPNAYATRGQQFLADDLGLGGNWIQTSYNSRGGIHYLPDSDTPSGGPHMRFNYACIGYRYDQERDAFIPPKPHEQAVLNESTCLWEIPIEVQIDLALEADSSG